MRVYLDLVILLNFGLNLLLLAGASAATGQGASFLRLSFGAALGALYAGACWLPGMAFLCSGLWQTVFWALMILAAFGLERRALRPGIVFLGLSFALGGAASRFAPNNALLLLLLAGIVSISCRVLQNNGQRLVPVQVVCGGKKARFTALRDTGNTLRDPISGEQVLIVEQQAAKELLPNTLPLDQPVEAMGLLRRQAPQTKPRLLPYRAVGQTEGMLLAIRCDRVTIAGRPAGTLVAFTNTVLSENGGFQALTGGNY